MELARTLKALWRRKWLVAIGALLAAIAATLSVSTVSLFPPSLTSRTNAFATGSTQMLVDTPSSAFANLAEEVEPLNTRASVFSRFLTSPIAIGMIARQAQLPADAIEGQGPYEQNVPLFEQEPTAEKRSSQIVGERALYRLRFENNPNLPIITVYAQAPTTDGATRLANAVPAAMSAYIRRIQNAQHTPAKRRVEIRQLGSATGGVVNAGANVQIALLVFFVVLIGWCLLLIPAHTVAKGWRSGSDDDDGGGSANGHGNGAGKLRSKRALRPYLERSTF
jgi:capsular polysaccharide biosynthesis protein